MQIAGYRVYILLAGLLLRLAGHAQTVQGKVLSAETNLPLAHAQITILNSLISDQSDSLGYYTLAGLVKGDYIISCKAEGYSSAFVYYSNTDLPTQLVFALTPAGKALDEVIISANKEDDQVVKVPASVSVLNAKKIEDARVWDMSNLTGIIPNYQYGNLGVGYQQQIAIRGISVFSENPAVATYVDGVCASDISANGLQLFDVERIEVLRGPQGTLYGRNAMGGVINIITKAPTNKTNVMLQSSAGNQGLQRYGFAVKTPLKRNKLFFGLSGNYMKQYGFYTNDLSNAQTFLHQPLKGTPEDGKRIGDEESYYANLTLKWIASSKCVLTFNSKAQQDNSVGASGYYLAAENDSIAISKPYTMALNVLGSNERKLFNNSLALQYFARRFNLVTSVYYQYILQAYDKIDMDISPLDYAYGSSYRNKPGDAFPQSIVNYELRFHSKPEAKRWKWNIGSNLFYQHYDKQFVSVYQNLAWLFGTQPGSEVNTALFINKSAALFGQTEYFIHPKFSLVAGLRYDLEERETTVSKFRINADNSRNYILQPTMREKLYNALSPKCVLNYHPGLNSLLFLSYNRGYRVGGMNMAAAKEQYWYYKPEISDNIELGYKLKSRNKRYVFSATAFAYQWYDLQLDVQPEPGIWIIQNVGNVRSVGGELEVNAMPLPGFQLDAGLGMNNARYGNFDYLGANIKGNQTVFSPKSTVFLSAQQLIPFGKKSGLSLRFEWRRIGLQYFDLVNSIEQKPYDLFNGRIDVSYKKINLAFWCQNIFNTMYLTYAMPGYFKYSLVNRPRTFGFTLTYTLKHEK